MASPSHTTIPDDHVVAMEVRLTLLNGAHNVGLELRMLFKHGGETLAAKFGRSLPTVSVENCETAIVAGSFEVILRHELYEQKRDKKMLTSLWKKWMSGW